MALSFTVFSIRKWIVVSVGFLILSSSSSMSWADDSTALEEATTPPVVPEYEVDVPLYKLYRPEWAVGLQGAFSALGMTNVHAFSVQAEYQPAFLQSVGVLGVGPNLAIYPGPSSLTKNAFGMYSLGGQVRYQARYFREQPLVPMVGYGVEYFNYSYKNGSKGHFLGKGVILGGMFLLNVIEPDGAAQFFMNHGVSRSYLVCELRYLNGNDATVSINDKSLFFGLRIEF